MFPIITIIITIIQLIVTPKSESLSSLSNGIIPIGDSAHQGAVIYYHHPKGMMMIVTIPPCDASTPQMKTAVMIVTPWVIPIGSMGANRKSKESFGLPPSRTFPLWAPYPHEK